MGLLKNLKNVFFEEVEVEEEYEETPKKQKEKKKVEEEKPVARQVVLPKAEPRGVEKEVEDEVFDLVEEDVKTKLSLEKENKISMDFDEDDFKVDNSKKHAVEEVPTITRRRSDENRRHAYEEVEKAKEEVKSPIIEETKIFDEIVDEEPVNIEEVVEEKMSTVGNYGIQEERHGLYEGKPAKKAFTPTPVISPVYGILDKNYKKEDVVSKKEVRLSTPSNKKLDLDKVREKAFGDLSNDISKSMSDDDYIEEVTDETVYDLEETNESPSVEKVTIGDAEEYFSELGLEYNNDYKDNSTSNSRRTTKRVEKKVETPAEKTETEELVETDVDKEIKRRSSKRKDDDELESNLFDLVDSMYEDKE